LSITLFLGLSLDVVTLFLLQFFDKLLLPFGGDHFSVCSQYSLLKHSSSKYLEHPSSFFHALIFGQGLLVTVSKTSNPSGGSVQ
jgi:hypothetical protein